MLLKSSWSFFNQKEETLKASHTKEKIITLFPSKLSFSLKSSSYLFSFFFFKRHKKHRKQSWYTFLFCLVSLRYLFFCLVSFLRKNNKQKIPTRKTKEARKKKRLIVTLLLFSLPWSSKK